MCALFAKRYQYQLTKSTLTLRISIGLGLQFPKIIGLITPLQFRSIAYVQGQSPEPKVREYFYFIDHQGMLFLDDSKMKNFTSCFKDKKFLEFFFKRLKLNNTGHYIEDFPYISLCGRERNFIRCDDYPIVFTHVVKKDVDMLSYGHAGDLLTVKFEPEKVIMLPQTGRVYHPATKQAGGIGLVRSQLAIEFSKYFQFANGENQSPTHFTWENTMYQLMPDWYNELETSTILLKNAQQKLDT